MISEAKNIWRSLNKFVTVDDLNFVLNLDKHRLALQSIKSTLEKVVDEDHRNLKRKSNYKGLNDRYNRLENDWIYKVSQAFLSKNKNLQGKKEQFTCIVARAIICQQLAFTHLDTMITLTEELKTSSTFLRNSDQVQISKMRELFEISKKVDRIKGYGREASSAIDDYCHFMDLANHLMGEEVDLYGKRFKADIYQFQLDTAIKELFTSRTESCDAAPFLIRSRLEIQIRRSIFKKGFMTPTRYVPTTKLSTSELLKSCKRNDVRFNYPNEVIDLILDNLHLVVHLGFRLNSPLLWYSFFVATNLRLIHDSQTKSKVADLFRDLEQKALVKKLEDTHYFKKSGLNIFWRY